MTRVSDPHPSAPGSARLVAFIREQCAAEAAAVIAQAQEHAQRVRAAAETAVQSAHAAAQGEGEERGRRRAAEILAVADAESRREWLHAREQLIDTTIGQAWLELARFPQMPNAVPVLADFIREALEALPPGPVRVQVPASYNQIFDAAQHMNALPDGRVISVETTSIPNGVIVETEDGRLRFDNSFGARARRRRETLRRLVAAILFSEVSAAQQS